MLRHSATPLKNWTVALFPILQTFAPWKFPIFRQFPLVSLALVVLRDIGISLAKSLMIEQF